MHSSALPCQTFSNVFNHEPANVFNQDLTNVFHQYYANVFNNDPSRIGHAFKNGPGEPNRHSLLLHLVRVGLGPLPPTCCWKSKWMIGESDSPSHFPTSSNHPFLTIPRWLFQIILSVTHLLNSLSPLFVQALCQLAVRCVYLIQDIIKNQVLLLPSNNLKKNQVLIIPSSNLRKIKFYLYQVAT